MRRVILLILLAVGLPTAAFANSITLSNSGGTLSGSSAGLTLTGSTLSGFGSIMGNLGAVSFSTGGLTSGNLQLGATFAGGGTFTITGNGTNGVPNGPIFTGTFTGPVTWTLITLANGTHNYEMTGTVSGTWFTGATANGATIELTINIGRGFFSGSAPLGGGGTNIDTVTPEAGTLGLVGTGLVG